MIKRLIYFLTMLIMANGVAMAQTNIPIVAQETDHGKILYLPSEAAYGAWVDFAVSCDNGYEEDQVCAYKVIENVTGTAKEPITVEVVNMGQ